MTTDTILAKNPRYAQCTKGPWSVVVEQGTMGEVVKVVAKVPLTEEQKRTFHAGLVAQGWHYVTICDNEPYYPTDLEEGNAQVIADSKLNAAKVTLLEPAFKGLVAAIKAEIESLELTARSLYGMGKAGKADIAESTAKELKGILQAAAEVTKQLTEL